MAQNFIDNQSYGFVPSEKLRDMTQLYTGLAGTGDTITLSETAVNFQWLRFSTSTGNVAYINTAEVTNNADVDVIAMGTGEFPDVPYMVFKAFKIHVNSATSLSVSYKTNIRIYFTTGGGSIIDKGGEATITAVHGVGRIN